MEKNKEILDRIFLGSNVEKSLGELFKNIREQLKILKSHYKKIVFSLPKSQFEQVLYDNYYLIEKFGKLLLKENKSQIVTASSHNVPILGYVIFKNCHNGEIPDTQSLISIISQLQTKKYVTNIELELLIWSFRYAVINELFNIYHHDNADWCYSLEMIMLLAKSDTFDLREITINCNPLEKLYSKEKCGIYPQMEKTTRIIYRNHTSIIASKLERNELQVAVDFLNEANSAFSGGKSEKESHVGYYIFNEYEKIKPKTQPKVFISLIAGISVFLSLLFTIILKSYWLWAFIFLPLWEFSRLIVELINSSGQETTYLPRIEINNTVPENAKTLVTISSLITSPKEIIELKNKLVRLHFSNLSENIKICALCDLKQAKLPYLAEDKVLVRNAYRMIKKLNEIYDDRFVLIIRKRVFSKTQNEYTGYERKRGAIEQLVRFIKGEKIDFLSFSGDIDYVSKVKYITALDYDTKALIDTVPELVSIAIHPLNMPELVNGKVKSGYGIITPRITTKLKSSLKSPFSKLVGGIGSSSAYDMHCANMYQDCFNEGIFSGKGLIDVDLFYKLCCGLFPSETILSHDILEGSVLRTAFAGDVEFSDGFPSTAISYFKRLHRWIRGDIQNFRYIFSKIKTANSEIQTPLNSLDRFKLFDNIRRAVLPINILLLIFLTFFLDWYQGLTLTFLAVVSVLIPYISSFISSLLNNGIYSLSRKYYSGVISQTTEIATQGGFALLLLPQHAIISFDAIVRAMWRILVSKKKLLEWTTAAQADRGGVSFLTKFQLFILPEILCLLLLFSPIGLVKLLAFIYLFVPFIIIYTDIPYKQKSNEKSPIKASSLASDLAAMWQLYEDYATKEDNYLPPDNVQFAPVYRICHRTSPTNIGLMMLSILIARDFDLIDSNGLFERINRTLSSVERLEKFKGNLYNWYETKTLMLSNNPFVSTVDSGNFVCCLVALKEGLKEYKTEHEGIKDIIERIESIIDGTDIGAFYDERKGLLSIGYNPQEKEFSSHHYDLLMSEARMTSYFAVAKRQVPKRHWRLLGRTMARQGLYSGPVSYSGTMFEFFMPELLLQSENGSLSYEGLKFCIYCQKKRGKIYNVPYGISESGYYAFDNALNYQYKAHGVQKLGLKRGLDNELVISPYSTFLTLSYDFDASYNNLKELKKYGMLGSYGYYEAIDFTDKRSPNGGSIIKSYMAHHVGMSIVSISNALHSGRIQKRFLKDNYMKSADELLQEKVIAGTVVFDDIVKKQESPKCSREQSDTEYYDRLFPSQPNIKLLCNGEYTLALTDLGASIAIYQGKDVYLRTTDLLRRPQGCYFAIEEDKQHTCLTYLPEYINSEEMSVEFGNDTVSYFSNTKELQLGMKVHLHNSLPCEIRQFAIKNVSTKNLNINLLSYIEPVLSTYQDNAAHPAFSKLFLKESYDIENKVFISSRKNRHNDEEFFCAVGFIEDVELIYNLNREDVLEKPYGVNRVFFNSNKFATNPDSVPDPCIFIKTPITLVANEKKEINLFILTSLDKEQLYQNIAKIRHNEALPTLSSSLVSSASIEGRLVNSILPQILFKKADCKQINAAIEANKLPLSSLWGLGISGDLPIVLVEITVSKSSERIVGYLKSHQILKHCGINYDLVFSYNDKGQYEREHYSMLIDTISELNMSEGISAFGGIHLIDIAEVDIEVTNLLQAVAIHIAPISMVRIGTLAKEFSPIEILPVEKVQRDIEQKLLGGGFDKNFFIIDKQTEMPWCNVLANPVFGTLLSDSSLGFTYAINSRENKLTPWFNDSRTDNRGEMLLIKCDDKYYDFVLGSTAAFSSERAIYYGKCEIFESIVTVSVSNKGMSKKIALEINWKGQNKSFEIAFYTEPVLGVTRDNSRMIIFSFVDDVFIAQNPVNRDITGFMSIYSSVKPKHHITNREAFLSGKWDENSISSSNEPCAAVVLKCNGKHDRKEKFDFYLSFGHSLESALKMPKLFKEFKREYVNQIKINTPDKNLNKMFNHWLDWQAIAGRIYARTGFYQNSGAWGFRDQLQDSCGCVLKNPEITKRQILRACTAQFPEGDVLHWWHKLPNNVIRGVRTRYSDDLVWLPYTLCEYIQKTSDTSILAINVAFCEGIVLGESQHEIYGEVKKTTQLESVYNHCKKALEKAFKLGQHNLILMGCGDWNDSFNGVGIEGKGESIWLSEFMIIVFKQFSKICEWVGDIDTKQEYLDKANILSKSLEEHCWDGQWYIRAFFDNGDELGSQNSKACKIDSLAQSFSVLAQLPNTERNNVALNSAYASLIDNKNGIIKLFTPAFERNEMPVGYATSYPPGIRENGGQYTHGSIWLAIALFEAGYYDKGFELINILNPANKYADEKIATKYKNEPFYISADIYTNPQCYGRGGWSIYTGAAAWYYRAIFEWFLGIKIAENKITISPNMPSEWDEFEIDISYYETQLHIVVSKGNEDGMFDNGQLFEFIQLDKGSHEVSVIIKKE